MSFIVEIPAHEHSLAVYHVGCRPNILFLARLKKSCISLQ